MSRKELLEIIAQAAREGREALDLSGRGISELPPEIGQLTNLTSLDLGDPWDEENKNQLTELPDEIGQLANLQMLALSGNQLTTLPESIAQLANLQKLDLWSNELTTLPGSPPGTKMAQTSKVYRSSYQRGE
jgi:internalin A